MVSPTPPLKLRIAVPTDFEALVSRRTIGPSSAANSTRSSRAVYSSRIELKQRTRDLERLLTTAEKLGVLCRWLGVPADDDVLWRGWEPMLFNQTHDLMSGVMTDRVYDDTIRGYDFSKRMPATRSKQDGEASRLASTPAARESRSRCSTRLGWPRTDIAVANVGFSEVGVADVRLAGPDGQAVPVQLLSSERYADGGLLRAEVAFVARDVPPLGYSVFA